MPVLVEKIVGKKVALFYVFNKMYFIKIATPLVVAHFLVCSFRGKLGIHGLHQTGLVTIGRFIQCNAVHPSSNSFLFQDFFCCFLYCFFPPVLTVCHRRETTSFWALFYLWTSALTGGSTFAVLATSRLFWTDPHFFPSVTSWLFPFTSLEDTNFGSSLLSLIS